MAGKQKTTVIREAIITSVDMNAPDGDNATYTISMTGSGALSKVE